MEPILHLSSNSSALSFSVFLTSINLSTVGAQIGYNIGAKMKDTGKPASLPWTLDLPILSLEW